MTVPNVLAKALFDNVAEAADELTFRKGDIITVIETDVSGMIGWWLCALHGRQGIAPGNRLQIVPFLPEYSNTRGVDVPYKVWFDGPDYDVPKSHFEQSDYDVPPSRDIDYDIPPSYPSPASPSDYDIPPTRRESGNSPQPIYEEIDEEEERLQQMKRGSKNSTGSVDSEEDIYKTPTKILSPKINNIPLKNRVPYEPVQEIYDVPSPRKIIDEVYDVPPNQNSSRETYVLQSPERGVPQEIYDIPKPVDETDSIYKFPQTTQNNASSGEDPSEQIYDVPPPLQLKNEEIYDVPPQVTSDKEKCAAGDKVAVLGLKCMDLSVKSVSTPGSTPKTGNYVSWVEQQNDKNVLNKVEDVKQGIYDGNSKRNSSDEDDDYTDYHDIYGDGNQPGEGIYDVPPQVTKDTAQGNTQTRTIQASVLQRINMSLVKGIRLEEREAIQRMTKLQTAVDTAVSKQLSYISPTWRKPELLKLQLGNIRDISGKTKVALRLLTEFGLGSLVNSRDCGNKDLCGKLSRTLEPLLESYYAIKLALSRLDDASWLPPLQYTPALGRPDDLETIMSLARGIPEDTRRLGAVISGNAALIYGLPEKPDEDAPKLENKHASNGKSEVACPAHIEKELITTSQSNLSAKTTQSSNQKIGTVAENVTNNVDAVEDKDNTPISPRTPIKQTPPAEVASKEVVKNVASPDIPKKTTVAPTKDDSMPDKDCTQETTKANGGLPPKVAAKPVRSKNNGNGKEEMLVNVSDDKNIPTSPDSIYDVPSSVKDHVKKFEKPGNDSSDAVGKKPDASDVQVATYSAEELATEVKEAVRTAVASSSPVIPRRRLSPTTVRRLCNIPVRSSSVEGDAPPVFEKRAPPKPKRQSLIRRLHTDEQNKANQMTHLESTPEAPMSPSWRKHASDPTASAKLFDSNSIDRSNLLKNSGSGSVSATDVRCTSSREVSSYDLPTKPESPQRTSPPVKVTERISQPQTSPGTYLNLTGQDRENLTFYSEEIDAQLLVLNEAMKNFFKSIQESQIPKIFVSHSKFIVLSAHKLVYIGDSLHRKLENDDARNCIMHYSNSLSDSIKYVVMATKTAALQYPALTPFREMASRVAELSTSALELRHMIKQNSSVQ